MSRNGQPFSLEDMMQLASSPAGQQLIQMLMNQDSAALQQAAQRAAAGDLDGAKSAISGLTQDPKIQKLLEQLGR